MDRARGGPALAFGGWRSGGPWALLVRRSMGRRCRGGRAGRGWWSVCLSAPWARPVFVLPRMTVTGPRCSAPVAELPAEPLSGDTVFT